ncbi:Zn-ribbon domain-containing OB-fold protein [Pseudonocardia sp. NPDC049154]|uniref:Zn-ribbon domain-containing OB-fold protein n=1 Tax=Pseudonocardia sp. NPDC049154 TaxID=3155501 RepID=UPI0033E63BE3
MTLTDRPVPHPSTLTEPFWAACREGRLLVQRCDKCGAHVFIPQEFCRECHVDTLTWVESAGVGHIVTYTVVWRPQTPAFEVPYVVAVVRLDEGYEMITNIVGAPPEAVAIDAPVRVRFTPVTDAITLPCFELAA